MAKPKPRRDQGLKQAFRAKTITQIAAGLGIQAASVSGWRRIPAERVKQVAQITGVPKEKLRPDIFGEAT